MTTPTATSITNAGDAEQAIANLNAIMDRLVETVETETSHVRVGRMREALALETTKAELARGYAAESARLKAARDILTHALPQEALAALRQRHQNFQALLQKNLAVLATAHAVSEGIIRGVSTELARLRSPRTYGATGRTNGPPPKASQPLALSRSI